MTDQVLPAGDGQHGIAITANDFFSGEVVYLGADGWQPWLSSALIYRDTEAAEPAMTTAARPDQVVGAYVIEVATNGKTLQPIQFRERIRALVPTNYRHGKQEQQD